MYAKPLDKTTLSELLDLYGRVIWQLARSEAATPAFRSLKAEQLSIESEARRRDQATWLPAAKEVNREPDGDIVFA